MWISILVNFIPVVIAIVIHEVAHGYAAYLLGDDTAKRSRRLSMNPLRHVDVFGTLLLPALLLLSNAGFLFGWAKPVPVDFSRLHHHRRDTVIVASAGIAANLLLALICSLLLPLMTYISASGARYRHVIHAQPCGFQYRSGRIQRLAGSAAGRLQNFARLVG